MTLNEKLSNVEWGEFKIGDLFDISIAKATDSNKLTTGDVPFVGRSMLNNGFDFECEMSDETKINESNTITVSMVATELKSFYQPYRYTCSQNIGVLNSSKLNKYTSMFINSIMNKHLKVKAYGYGYPVSLQRLRSDIIILPKTVDEDGEDIPDWDFMEEFMREVEKEVRPDVEFEPHIISDNRELDEVEWGEFKVGELFTLSRGKESAPNQNPEGDTPIINETALGNGMVREVVGTQVFEAPAITVSINFADTVFYQESDFAASVNIVILQNENLNKYNGLFLAQSISHVNKKYDYAYKTSNDRLKAQVIPLPKSYDEDGEEIPDWTFMEEYMKRIENELMERVLD